LLVPVAESVTVRNTVAYAIDRAQEALDETGDAVELHFVVVASTRSVDPDAPEELGAATELLDRIDVWVDEDLGPDRPSSLTIEQTVIGTDRYLFSPADYANALLGYADEHGIDRIILDPEYNPVGTAPMLSSLASELERGDVAVEQAPVERPAESTALFRTRSLTKYALVFGVSYLFYLLLSTFKPLDFATGAITAALVAVLLGPIAFNREPSIPSLLKQSGRMAIYVPYLVWEIVIANLQIAYVVLHPSLPIDPEMVHLEAAVWGDAPVTTLANSITLTPGTLTVSVSDRAFDVHSLTVGSRTDLLDGGLERAVRFVFYGRGSATIPSPAERGDGDEVSEDG